MYPKQVRIKGGTTGPECRVYNAANGEQMAYVQGFSMALSIDDNMPLGQFLAIRPGILGAEDFARDGNGELIEETFEAEIVEINLKKVI